MHSASFKGDMEGVKRIVGENPLAANARGDYLRTPLMLAAGAGHMEVRGRRERPADRRTDGWREGGRCM